MGFEPWSEEEINLILKYYESESSDFICKRIEKRTWGAIKRKAQGMGLKRNLKPCLRVERRITDAGIQEKKCTGCNNFLPINSNYFHINRRCFDGYENKCKKCSGYEYGYECEEGFQICKECNRKLPLDLKYFHKNKSEKNFRGICRECNPRYKGFRSDKYKPKVVWTDKDNELFLERYPQYTNEELIQEFYPFLNEKQIIDKAYRIKAPQKTQETLKRSFRQRNAKISKALKGFKKDEGWIRKISETKKRLFREGKLTSPLKGRIVSYEEKENSRIRNKGKWSGANNPRHSKPLKGSDNGRWMGGITSISTALRENISQWKKDSMKACDYKCVVTGDKFSDIHHLIPFNNIVKKALEELSLDIKPNLGKYDEKSRIMLIKRVEEIHKDCLGVCLNKQIHKVFHDNYTYSNCNASDFKKFLKEYFEGKYDEVLDEDLKSFNSKRTYREAMRIVSF